MSRTNLILCRQYFYALERDELGALHLAVLCGGVGQYEVAFVLNGEERRGYETEGKPYLDRLAQDVYAHPKNYRDRGMVPPLRWDSLCARLGIPPGPGGELGRDLEQRYTEPHRHYHNLEHISRMLDWLEQAPGGGDALELAIWYHDAIYEPLARDNEARSARHAEEQLGPWLAPDALADVTRLILVTDPAQPRTGRPDEALMADLDLSILSALPEEYEAYAAAIRREYADVPEEDFRRGRAALLEKFLTAPIYGTEFFAPREKLARANLQAELEQLHG